LNELHVTTTDSASARTVAHSTSVTATHSAFESIAMAAHALLAAMLPRIKASAPGETF
jgi:hypothetical protein